MSHILGALCRDARLAARRIGIASSVPIPLLHQKGLAIGLGQDSITGRWSPFGSGDNLEKAGRLAKRFGWSDERSLGQALGFITRGKTPLDPACRRDLQGQADCGQPACLRGCAP